MCRNNSAAFDEYFSHASHDPGQEKHDPWQIFHGNSDNNECRFLAPIILCVSVHEGHDKCYGLN